MSGNFLDSKVLLYVLSADDAKGDIAETLLTQAPTISVQVLNDITSVCARKLKMPWPEIAELLQAVKAACRRRALDSRDTCASGAPGTAIPFVFLRRTHRGGSHWEWLQHSDERGHACGADRAGCAHTQPVCSALVQ